MHVYNEKQRNERPDIPSTPDKCPYVHLPPHKAHVFLGMFHSLHVYEHMLYMYVTLKNTGYQIKATYKHVNLSIS